jgi:hypothetical protein
LTSIRRGIRIPINGGSPSNDHNKDVAVGHCNKGDAAMRLFNVEAFKGSVSGLNTPVYTSAEFSSVLAEAEKYFLQAIVTQASGTAPKIQITLETSCDGNNWVTKSTPIAATSLTANTVNVVTGYETGSQPAGMFVRAAITLTNNADNNCNVRLFICGRAEQSSL